MTSKTGGMLQIEIILFDGVEPNEVPEDGQHADGGARVQIWSRPGEGEALLAAIMNHLAEYLTLDVSQKIEARESRRYDA